MNNNNDNDDIDITQIDDNYKVDTIKVDHSDE